MTLDKIAARFGMQEVLDTSCEGGDQGDVALIRSAYHPDAFDDHGRSKG